MPYKKNGFWVFAYRDPITGKSKAKSTKLTDTKQNKILAIQREKQFKEILNSQPKLTDKALVLTDIFNLYCRIKQLRPATVRSYELAVRHFVYVNGDKPINLYIKADYTKLILFFNEQKLKTNSIAIYTRNLLAIFNFAIEQEFIQKNIIKATETAQKEIEIIPEKDFVKLLDYFKSNKRNRKHYYFCKLAYLTAFRVSSLVALQWEHIDFENGFIFCPNIKGARTQNFPMTDDIIELLKEYGLRKTGSIFNFKSTESIKFFQRAMKKLGFKYNPHQMRKSGITNWVNMQTPLFDVQVMAMHQDVKTTQRYYAKADLDRIKTDLQKRKNQQN